MKRSLFLLFVFLQLICASYAQAQNRVVTGRVLSQADGDPLPGVSVSMKDKTSAISTDMDGAFKITVPITGSVTLVFKYIGYKTREVALNQQKEITVRLQSDVVMLNEVVTIGYKNVQRKDITGAVASVNAKQLKDIPINSAAEALAGRLAGVQVTANEGAPGSDVRILVRGGGSITQSNSPLYIVDGVQVEDGLSSLSPTDIESVEVLKDASETAIYGARGANGVVVITTKGGKEMKTVVSYNGYFGLSKLQNELAVMDPYNFVLRQYERTRGVTNNETAFLNDYGTFANIDQYKSVAPIDWQKKTFGRNAISQTHNLAITGGTKTTTFNISYTNNNQQAIMLGSNYARQLINLKLDHRASDNFRAGINFRFNDQVIDGAGVSSDGSGAYSLLRHTVKYKPINNTSISDDEEDDDYYNDTNTGNGLGVLNPVELSSAQYRKRLSKNLNINGYINYTFNKYLSFRSTAGVNYTFLNNNAFDDYLTSNARLNGAGLPVVTMSNTQRYSLNNSNVFNFTLNKGKHNFSALLGQEIYNLKDQLRQDLLKQFPLGITPEKALGQLSLGVSSPLFPSNTITESRLLSFFTGLNYNFDDKYLAKFTLRTDGSTKFAPDKRWGYFPSGSIGWRISKEDFMKDVSFISDLKLRASYGASGNNRIGDYLYLTSFATNAKYALNEIVDPGYTSSALANKNLQWETTVTQNLGLDFAMFKNRLQVNVDVYKSKVKNLLLDVRIPSISGYVTQLQNVGQTSNKGLEIQLNAIPVQTKHFSWTTNFNIAFNRNRIDNLSSAVSSYLPSPAVPFVSGQPADYIVQVGQSVGTMYGYTSDGFYTVNDFNYNPATQVYTLKPGVTDVSGVIGTAQPGWMKLKDRNGDGIITEADKGIIGNATPKYTGGLNQQFTYKNFDMSVFVNFVVGNSIYNANKIEFTNGYTPNTNMLAMMSNRWKTVDASGNVVQKVTVTGGVAQVTGIPPDQLAALNANASIWQPISGTGAFFPTSWAIEDGSFMRINNITLGYTFPVKLVNKVKINRLRVYATANNLAVVTGYSGYDPEVNVRSSNPVTPGVDYSAYPRSRTYILGLNLTL